MVRMHYRVFCFASVMSSTQAQALLEQLTVSCTRAISTRNALESTKAFVNTDCTFEAVFGTPLGELPATSSNVGPMENEVGPATSCHYHDTCDVLVLCGIKEIG